MSLLSVQEIEQRLRDNAESIARQCIPNGKVEGKYFLAGDVMGGPGDSLVLYLNGERAGKWRHYAGTNYGDMLDLIELSQGCSGKGEAVAIAKQWLGIDEDWRQRGAVDPAEQQRRAAELARQREERTRRDAEERAAKIRGARALYLAGGAAGVAGTPVEQYLLGRGLDAGEEGRWPGALRYHPEVWNAEERAKLPAMVAPIYLHDGVHIGTHRTWLQPDKRRGWVKLDCNAPKKVLGSLWGGFIPINKGKSGKPMRTMPAEEPVYVTEGIEDALVVRMARPDARIICAVSLGNIGAVVLPEQARELVIVADRDEKPAAIDALERSIAQQQARGLHVRIVMPEPPYKDLNAWYLAKLRAAHGKGAAP